MCLYLQCENKQCNDLSHGTGSLGTDLHISLGYPGPLKHWPMPPEAKSTAESTKMSNVM